MTERFKIVTEATVLADTPVDAIRTVQRALGTSEQIEHYTTLGMGVTAVSPWRDRTSSMPPQDGKPFFARDVRMEDDAEFATAVKWHAELGQFVDANLSEYPFTHWMPIPPL